MVKFLGKLDDLYSDSDQWGAGWVDTLCFAVKQSCQFHAAPIYDLLEGEAVSWFDASKADLASSGR